MVKTVTLEISGSGVARVTLANFEPQDGCINGIHCVGVNDIRVSAITEDQTCSIQVGGRTVFIATADNINGDIEVNEVALDSVEVLTNIYFGL